MDAGRENDTVIAEQVMGWKWYGMNPVFAEMAGKDHPWIGRRSLRADTSNGVWTVEATADMPIHDDFSDIPHYTADIAAAWLVVDHLRVQGIWLSELNGGYENSYRCCFAWKPADYRHGTQYMQMFGTTAPEAICTAALATVKAMKESATE